MVRIWTVRSQLEKLKGLNVGGLSWSDETMRDWKPACPHAYVNTLNSRHGILTGETAEIEKGKKGE